MVRFVDIENENGVIVPVNPELVTSLSALINGRVGVVFGHYQGGVHQVVTKWPLDRVKAVLEGRSAPKRTSPKPKRAGPKA